MSALTGPTNVGRSEPAAHALRWLGTQIGWERRFQQLRVERALARSRTPGPARDLEPAPRRGA